jgi:hypothetical protein
MNNSDLANSQNRVKEFTLDMAQAADTYDICEAHGNILIKDYSVYVHTAGTTFTSCRICTDNTIKHDFMTAAEGNRGSYLAAVGDVASLGRRGVPHLLVNGKKIQFIMEGSTGVGSLRFTIIYRKMTHGAFLEDLT